jgi:uncharacterized repeat protein (TIGR03803 family)
MGVSENGSNPLGALTPDSEGNLYGVTTGGGANNYGVVFKIGTNGSLTTLVSFDYSQGAFPNGFALSRGDDGAFYGTTASGGSGNKGTVFKVTTNGDLTTLVHFDGTNGNHPGCNLLKSGDGNFYGTTTRGGQFNLGTVFKMTAQGELTTLISFNQTYGSIPYGPLGQGRDGNFYGTTSGIDYSNPRAYGTFFKLTTNGVLTTMIRFDGTNAKNPAVEFTMARNGHLYGTLCDINKKDTLNGNVGTIFRLVETPVLTSAVVGNSVILTWNSFTNGIYRLEKNSSLNPAIWTAVTTNIVASGNTTSFTNTNIGTGQELYRIVLLP